MLPWFRQEAVKNLSQKVYFICSYAKTLLTDIKFSKAKIRHNTYSNNNNNILSLFVLTNTRAYSIIKCNNILHQEFDSSARAVPEIVLRTRQM